MRIFKRSVWTLLSIFTGILFMISIIGSAIANENQAGINAMLGINAYKKIDISDDENVDTEYFKSKFYNSNGEYDHQAMRDNSEKIALQVAVEGSVLLWNNDIGNGAKALPLKKNTKVNLFGVSTMVDNWSIPSRHFLIQGEGSGMMYDNDSDPSRSLIRRANLSAELEKKGLIVNKQLVQRYNEIGGTYRKTLTMNSDFTYKFGLNEAPWSQIESTVNSSVDGGAAVMIISRNAGEYKDILVGSNYVSNSHLDQYNYLDLSVEEADILNNLKRLKNEGRISSIILLINAANPVQFQHIKNYDIDACVFIGMGGSMSFVQIAEILTAQNDDYILSGHLVDTLVYNAKSAPAFENYGDFTWTEYSNELPDLNNENKNQNGTHNTKYVVYQEGIYVGYKYYETRYEDAVLEKDEVLGGSNATSSKGVKAGSDNWSYEDEVAFPFGYGLSYTSFEHSNFSVTPSSDGNSYEASITIKNVGEYSGKDTFQVYLQKPYTEYDRANGIEKAAVELVGFAKTKKLKPNESQRLTITINKDAFRTYDAYGKKTYILEKGTYYIATGTDAHDALNNILAQKILDGHDVNTNIMTSPGNAAYTYKVVINNDDYEIFSKSKSTGKKITNQFDNADINLYEGTQDQKIVYLSRSDWDATYPKAVEMKCIDAKMVADMQYGAEIIQNENDKMPNYGKDNGLTLAMLMEYDFDDPIWDDLLDQMTLAEQQFLCSYGLRFLAGATSVGAPGGKAHDGPVGIKVKNPILNSQMCFPSPVNMASTWNVKLIKELGDALGHEVLHANHSVIYAPGANIHRTAYSGRNWEYFSEDAFISGKMLSAEVQGLQERGVIPIVKHFVLNDQETNRYGVTTWANEQSIRENYLYPFEIAITEGNLKGVMSSFNRIGCTWAGAHKGLLTEVLRNEWNFIGIVESDACAGGVAHMTSDRAKAAGLLAGNDLWMDSGNEKYFEAYKDNPTVMLSLRQAAKRILYTQLHSNAMNGISSTTRIIKVKTWWQNMLLWVQIVAGIIFGLIVVMTVLSFIFGTKKFKNWYNKRLAIKRSAKIARMQAIAENGQAVGKGYYVNDIINNGVEKPIKTGYYIDGKKQRISTIRKDILILSVSIILTVAITLSSSLPFINNQGAYHDNQQCTQICKICKGCLDSGCNTCKTRCGEGKTAYEFEAERAIRIEGIKSPTEYTSQRGTSYIGNLNENIGAGLLFNIYSPKETVATLVAVINRRSVETTFSNLISVEVNGEKFTSPKIVKATSNGAEDWIAFVDVTLGCINLQHGNNVIKLITINDLSYNIDMIKLKCDEPLKETYSYYKFEASKYAIPGTGSKGAPRKENNGFVGNLSENAGATLTFKIVSEEETTAILSAAVTGRRQVAREFSKGFITTVNGVELETNVVVPQGDPNTEWSRSYEIVLGEIQLVKGENTIVFKVPQNVGIYDASNFDYILITSQFEVTCSSEWQ
ncbi:MAG TPA: glycoside hydrolase family 3 N-terminal domain-containing protein [Clostridia bacterium]